MQASLRGYQARENLALMGLEPTPSRGILKRMASDVNEEATRVALDPATAEYAKLAAFFTESLSPVDRRNLRIASIEKLHVEHT